MLCFLNRNPTQIVINTPKYILLLHRSTIDVVNFCPQSISQNMHRLKDEFGNEKCEDNPHRDGYLLELPTQEFQQYER